MTNFVCICTRRQTPGILCSSVFGPEICHFCVDFYSEWAFGLNRRIGSVCSVAVNFGFHRSTTDRFAIESKTDEFGVGFVGSVFRFHRTNRGEHRGTNQQRERRTGEEQIDKERSQMPRAPLPASAKSCSALSASSSELSDSPPRCRRPPRRCSRRHRFA